MAEITLEPFQFIITFVHESGSHVIGLRTDEKRVVFLNVANAESKCINETVKIASAKTLSDSDCPPKFYKPYGISDPYAYGWKFSKLITESVVFAEEPPFRPIPLSKNEIRGNLIDSMVVGSVWTNGKNTWVIRDSQIEKLAGSQRLRVWVTDANGKKGQAVYADSLAVTYKKMNKEDLL